MPEHASTETYKSAPPCAGDAGCAGAECLQRCLNCRREIEASMSRIAGRRLRRLRGRDECSAERCAAFLRTVRDESMRLHLSSMAWWRFSADNEGAAAPVYKVMVACRATTPGSGEKYLQDVVRTLSPLSQTQLAAWFGCENFYQVAALFIGDRPPVIGKHCMKCGLYKQGCTAYDRLGADDCPFWNDRFVQGVATAIKKAGGTWRDPCKGIPDGK